MRLSLRLRAELDIDEAYAWYESRRRGLGEVFLYSVDASFDRLRREPELYAIQHDRVRRARVHRFPYWVHYVIRLDHVDVLYALSRAPSTATFHTLAAASPVGLRG